MKKLVFLAALCVAFFAVFTASAQNVKNAAEVGVDIKSFPACREYLAAHPTDTLRAEDVVVATENKVVNGSNIVAGDTLLCTISVFKNAEGKVAQHKAFSKKVVVMGEPRQATNFETAAVIDRKAEESQFTYNLTKNRKANRKDVIGYKSDDVREIYNNDRGNAGVVVAKAADKDGWSVEAQASYQVAEGCNTVGGSAGVAYTGSWWQVYVNGGITRSMYTENADHAGQDYWAYKAESGLLVQPFKFDRYDQNRLFIGGGCGWEHYVTDSREWTGENGELYDLSSEGNYLYLHGDLKFEHRFFATGNSIYAKLQLRQKKFIYQNADTKCKLALEFAVGMNLGFFRNRINNTK
ncbi:MAG: hypothetical protein J6J35_03535 [Alphaproteobacteria bacterium]|nr:hypothetical protein [Alphaproteobacteria bacterium]